MSGRFWLISFLSLIVAVLIGFNVTSQDIEVFNNNNDGINDKR